MKHTFIARDELVRKNALQAISSMPLDPLHEIIIREYKKNRSLVQNALYWYWITAIAGERGETKDYIHFECRKSHLVRIYERDDPDYAKMIKAVREVHRAGMRGEAKDLSDQIVKLTSTTTANIAQFTEYLNDIETDVLGKGIVLEHPEDKYYEAMGIKR